MSQLDLAIAASVTPRHVSFVETGRSSPSREMLLQLADALAMPLRDRNELYLAAGYAPPHRELSLDDDELRVAMSAVERILASHDPLPAVVLDRHWNLVRANQGAQQLFGAMLDLASLPAPVNVLELIFDPAGLRHRIANFDQLAPALLARARREAVGGVLDTTLREIVERLERESPERRSGGPDDDRGPLIDVAFIVDGSIARYFSTVTTLGTPRDITLQELRIEMFHPA
jgi:transcriptional regulator with XRE-family HTH domain